LPRRDELIVSIDFDALRRAGLAWRTVFGNGSGEAVTATVMTDLAVTASLAATVPPGLDVLTEQSGLPELATFAINLHLPRVQASPITQASRATSATALSGKGD